MGISRRDLLAGVGACAGLAAGAGRTARGEGSAAGAVPPGEPREVRTPDGLRLAARTYGDPARPEILFVHGLAQSRLCWDRQVAALADRFRVVTFDLRGHGDSDKPNDPAAYADGGRWADDLRAVSLVAGLRRPTVVGWSLGGLIIGHYLIRFGPGGLGGINLVAAVTKQSRELLTDLANDYAPRLGTADLAARVEARRTFLAACFVEPPPRDEFERMLVYNGMMPPVLPQNILPIAGGERIDDAWAGSPRLLVTYGARDALVREAMATRLLGLNPKARLSRYADAGHSPFYEDAPRFNRELADFAAGAGG